MYACDGRVIAIARERVRGGPPLPAEPALGAEGLRRLERELRNWQLDWTRVDVDVGAGRVEIEVGPCGSAPLYVGVHAGLLVASPHLERHSPYLRLGHVDRGYLAHLLAGTAPYGARTAFEPVQLLTERGFVSADTGGLRSGSPESAPYYRPVPLRSGARVAGAYVELVRSVLALWPLDDVRVLSELSGGLDSAVVTLIAASSLHRAPETYALAVEGRAAAQQAERRRMILARTATRDLLWDTRHDSIIPASLAEASQYRPGIYNADYQLPLCRVFSALGHVSGHAVTTGTGGDELFMPHFFELDAVRLQARLDITLCPDSIPDVFTASVPALLEELVSGLREVPHPLVPQSCLQAQAARAPLFIDQGLWAVSPLCHPLVVRFCRSLPREYREGKALQRAALEELGAPRAFADAPLRENFVPLLWRSFLSVRESVAREAAEGMLLADLDLIRPDCFVQLMTSIADPERDIQKLSVFFNVFNMERLLRDISCSRSSSRCSGPSAISRERDAASGEPARNHG